MVTKIDTQKLGEHIGELNTLYQKWSNYEKVVNTVGDNGGATVIQMEALTKSLHAVQDGLNVLLKNTMSYMQQRKDSVETKEKEAAEKVKQQQNVKRKRM